jgi:hypothetical protein
VTTTPAACANCGAPFEPERRRFCPECGQETHVKPPTLMEFVQQFGGAYFSTEGALWRTLKLLIFKPGELTRQYLAGRRKHYVLPLRLYLTISLVVLLAMRVAATMQLDQPGAIRFDIGKDEVNVISVGKGMRAGMDKGQFFCEGFPPWICKRIQRRMDLDQKGLEREAVELSARFVSNIGLGMFVLLPVFALLLELSYWGRRMRYTEHLVFALHVHAFWFFAMLLTLPDKGWLSAFAFAAIVVYPMLALRRVYGGRWWPRLLRAGFITLGYFVALVFALVGVALWTVLF